MSGRKRPAPSSNSSPAAVDNIPLANSQLCFMSQLALFKPPPIRQTCISDSEWILTDPVTAIRGDAQVVDFVLPISADGAYDLANLRVKAQIKIVDKDGQPTKGYSTSKKKKPDGGEETETSYAEDSSRAPAEYDPVALVNNTLASMFGKVEMSINDTWVASSNTNHHYKSFIQNTVNYPSASRTSLLAMSGYSQELYKKPEVTSFSDNVTLTMRAKQTQKGGVVTLYGRLSHDLFSLTRLLPIGTKVGLRLHKNRDELLLCVDGTHDYHIKKGYRVSLEKIQVETLRHRLTPETISVLEASLANAAAKYYFVRTEIRTFYVAPGAASNYQNNLFVGQKPSRIFLGFIPTRAYQGTYTTNPLVFQPQNVRTLCMRVDNRILDKTLDLSWEKSCGALDAYAGLLKALRVLNRSQEVDPEYEDYRKGPMCLFGWDLSQDLTDASPSQRCGTVSLETTFDPKASDEGLVGIALGMFFASMHIDRYGSVQVFEDFQN